MSLNDQTIARIVHEANRALCISQGDNSQSSWDDAEEWQKKSALQGVRAVRANPEQTAEQNHQNWWDHKMSEGWIYGPIKNSKTREHPCCVPYDELPPEQQTKDKLFLAIVKALI